MSEATCPICETTEILDHPDHHECATCGHERLLASGPLAARVVRDANGNVPTDGDSVTLIKHLPLKGLRSRSRAERR